MKTRARNERGTTLIELMIAVALFAIISGAAFTLMSQQQNASLGVTGQVGLNMGLRNAAAMLQMDLANAGTGYYQALNVSSGLLSTGPVGVTILNNVVATGTSCYTSSTSTYGPNCFDELSILSIDTNYPVVNATDTTGLTSSTSNCSYTDTGTAYGQLGYTINQQTGAQTYQPSLAATAASYKIGDQLLLVSMLGSIAQYTSVVLTAVPTVNSTNTAVVFTFNKTVNGTNALQYDPLNISACSGNATCPSSSEAIPSHLFNQFCGNDFILKVKAVTYQVCAGPGSLSKPKAPATCDTTSTSPDIANPKLVRTDSNGTTTVMEQVVGFKVGGAVWNDPNTTTTDITYYNYDSSTYSTSVVGGNVVAGANAYDFTYLRSVRVSLIGRTAPDFRSKYVFRNGFDGGAYQVQGTALVVNPRNMNPEALQ
jgi:prepilin-type N-terminal cleavage/methylation domain-containing protein